MSMDGGRSEGKSSQSLWLGHACIVLLFETVKGHLAGLLTNMVSYTTGDKMPFDWPVNGGSCSGSGVGVMWLPDQPQLAGVCCCVLTLPTTSKLKTGK